MPSSVYFGKTKNNGYSISDNIKYRYDEMGNISEIKENGVLVAKYTYDKIGRLIREDNRKFKKTTLWSYDNCGNILSKREANFTLKPTDEIETFTAEKLYAYNGDKLLSYGDELLSYIDTDGNEHVNPRVYRNNNLTWNYERQLASFGDTQFGYDGYGRRIKKNDTVFTYDANSKLIKQSDGTNTLEFMYDNSGLSGVTLNGIAYVYGKDIQSNIVSILDNSGHEVVQYSYDAWGNYKTTILDEAHAAIAGLNPFRYRSYYLDIETNLYYLQARYYDPEIGRFISQDDVSYLDPEHINGLNLFAYCGNNPVMNVDPLGCSVLATIALVFAAIVLSAAIGGLCGGIASTIAGDGFLSGFVGGMVSGAITAAGIAIALATGNVFAGIAIVAVSGFAGGAVGNLIQQSMSTNPNKQGIDPTSVVIAGALGATFATLTYILMAGAASISVGIFEAEGATIFAKILSELQLSAEGTLFTITVGLLINIIQMFIDIVIGALRKENEEETKKKMGAILRR